MYGGWVIMDIVVAAEGVGIVYTVVLHGQTGLESGDVSDDQRPELDGVVSTHLATVQLPQVPSLVEWPRYTVYYDVLADNFCSRYQGKL